MTGPTVIVTKSIMPVDIGDKDEAILRKASAYFAQAEPDRPFRR